MSNWIELDSLIQHYKELRDTIVETDEFGLHPVSIENMIGLLRTYQGTALPDIIRCRFGEGCYFGDGCSFGAYCYFGAHCDFGKECHFGELCGFGDGGTFGVGCSFGEWCTFGEWCSVGVCCNYENYKVKNGHYVAVDRIGSNNQKAYFYIDENGNMFARVGCWFWDMETFKEWVKKAYTGTIHEKTYLAACDLAELMLKGSNEDFLHSGEKGE